MHLCLHLVILVLQGLWLINRLKRSSNLLVCHNWQRLVIIWTLLSCKQIQIKYFLLLIRLWLFIWDQIILLDFIVGMKNHLFFGLGIIFVRRFFWRFFLYLLKEILYLWVSYLLLLLLFGRMLRHFNRWMWLFRWSLRDSTWVQY